MKNRLIDADEVKNSLLTELLMGVDGGTDASYLKTYEVIGRIEKIINEWVDNQPTVKAIPIEWIKGYITPFQVHHDSLSEELKENDGAGWVVDVLETMLREWEKENSVKISEGNYDSDEEYEEQMRCLDEN